MTPHPDARPVPGQDDLPLPRLESTLLTLACGLPFCNVARLPPNPAFWGEWAGAALFACWLVSRLWRGSGASRSASRPVSWVALVFPAVAALVAAQIALRMVRSPVESLVIIAALLLAGAACVAATAMLHSGERAAALRAAAWGLLIALFANGAAVVLGWTGHSVILLDIERTTADVRAVGLIGQANQLGTLSVLALAAATYLKGQNQLPRGAWVGVLVVAAVVCAASGSRIAVIEWLLAIALAWWHGRGRHEPSVPTVSSGRMLAGSLGVFLAAQLVWVWVAAGVVSSSAQSAVRGGSAGRFEMLRDGLAMGWQHPWLGVGQGNYAGSRVFELSGALLAPHADNTHNVLVQALAEWGLPGLLLTGAALLMLLYAALHRESPRAAAEHTLAATVVLCLLAHSMVEHPLWFVNLLLLFALFAGLLRLPMCFGLGAAAPVRQPVRVVIAAATVAVSALVALDYARIQTLAMRVYAQGIGAPDVVSRSSLAEISRIAVATLHPTEAAIMQGRAFAFDSDFADYKFAVSERALRGVPSPETVARYVAFAALTGQQAKGQALLADLALRNASLYAESVKILGMFAEAHPSIGRAMPKGASAAVGPG